MHRVKLSDAKWAVLFVYVALVGRKGEGQPCRSKCVNKEEGSNSSLRLSQPFGFSKSHSRVETSAKPLKACLAARIQTITVDISVINSASSLLRPRATVDADRLAK